MQFVEVCETLDGEDCVGADKIAPIKTTNKAISRLSNTNYPMNRSPED